MKSAIITLTTDFGTADGFVAAMKGVLLSIAKNIEIVDVSHDIGPGDIRGAAFVLSSVARYFPKGAIHVAVVDPGVGSKRRPISLRTRDAFFVGPDNGIFTPWLDGAKVYHLNKRKYFLSEVSRTFHGRDVFAPVAAHLANGVSITNMGKRMTDAVRIESPTPIRKGTTTAGEIVHIDRFGNLITNIPGESLDGDCMVEIAGATINGLSECYSSGERKHMALVGSHGNIEIAMPMGNAAMTLDADVGTRVKVVLRKKKQG